MFKVIFKKTQQMADFGIDKAETTNLIPILRT